MGRSIIAFIVFVFAASLTMYLVGWTTRPVAWGAWAAAISLVAYSYLLLMTMELRDDEIVRNRRRICLTTGVATILWLTFGGSAYLTTGQTIGNAFFACAVGTVAGWAWIVFRTKRFVEALKTCF